MNKMQDTRSKTITLEKLKTMSRVFTDQTIEATFSGKVLILADERSFHVKSGERNV